MISSRGKRIKIVCSLVILVAIALMPATGSSNSSVQAAEAPQMAPINPDFRGFWENFGDLISGMFQSAAINNIVPDTGWDISAIDLAGWLGEYSSIAVDMASNPDMSHYNYTDIAPKYAHLISGARHGTPTIATLNIPERQAGFQNPAYAKYYEMQNSLFESLKSLEDMGAW